MTIRRILSQMSIFVTLASFVCVAPSWSAAQMKKGDNEQKIAAQWVDGLMKKDDEGVRGITQLPLYFDDSPPLTDVTQISSAFMAALATMVGPDVNARVGLKPGSPRTIVAFLSDEKGPPDDQTLKNMSLEREDIAVPVLVVQGGKPIGNLLIVLRNSKVARVFSAGKRN